MLELLADSEFFLGLTLAFLFLTYILFSQYSYQNKNPCPQSYPIVGNLIGFLLNCHRFHDWVAEFISTSPSLTIQVNGFLGLSHGICTADPANVEHLLRSNFTNYVKGTRFQSHLDELLGNGIFTVDGDLWNVQRKISSHEFTTKSLRLFISDTVHSQISARLVPLLSSSCDRQEVIDLQDVLQKFTFDNICNVAFGVDPASIDLKNDDSVSSISSFVQAFDYAVETSSKRFMLPLPLIWKIKRLLNIGSEKKFKEAIRVINNFAVSVIRSKEEASLNRNSEVEDDQDLLSRFMHSTVNLGFSNGDEKTKFLRDIVISFVLAGKDSTSTALTWFFWLLAGHPRCECLIYNQLSAASLDGTFTYDNLKHLNYLHAALSESLRLFPPVPINSRLTISDDTLSSGMRVRKGWFADYSAYAMGRMEKLWGADCREFKPERWLDENGCFIPCDQFKFPVFHCGPRTCLGKEMAYVQMKSIAAAILYEFEVAAVDGGGIPDRIANPPYTLSILLKMKGGLPVRLQRRNTSTRLIKCSSKK